MRGRSQRPGARYFWAGFVVVTVLVLIGYYIIGVWPAGDGTVLIIDSLHQYLPFYTDFHEKLVNHESLFYSFGAGLGYNFWATYAYYLASPFNFLIALVPTANVCDFMDFSILLKLAACGGIFSWYLGRRRRRGTVLCVAFGTMYALSFFLIGYYFNLMWLDSIAVLPLIMKGIETICGIGDEGVLTDTSSGWLYGLALTYGLWCNYYIGFMLCIFSVLYFFVCLVIRGRVTIRAFFGRVLRFGWYSLLAGATGALVLLPAYMSLTSSESMTSNKFPTVIKFYDSFVDMMLTHFAAIKPINISNTQVGLNAYCGVSVLLLVILFVLDSRRSIRDRAARLLLTAFLFLSFSLNILNYIWHGFHQQNGLPNRFAFIYVAVILVMSFDALYDIKHLALWKIVVSGAIPVTFALWAFLTDAGVDHEDNPYDSKVYLITLTLLCGYFLLLLVLRASRLTRDTLAWVVGSALILEAGCSGVYGIVCNDKVTRSIYLADQTSYKNLMKEIGDETFYRSEVDAQRMRNVTLYCGGHSTVMFNSTMQESVTHFCDRIGMESRTNKNGYNGLTDLMNDLLGVKYVLSANGTGSAFYHFPAVTDDGNLTVYENEDALSIGYLVNEDILEWDIDAGTPIDVQESFVKLATGLGPIYTLDRYLELESGVANGIRIPENKQVYVYLQSRVDSVDLTTPEYTKNYKTFTDHLYTIYSCDGNYDATFTAGLSDVTAQNAIIYTCPDELEKEVTEYLAKCQLEDVHASGSTLSGSLTADRDGILLITIPYDESWTVTVDGEKTDAVLVGDALLGIRVSEGDHEVKLTYLPQGFKQGAVISAAGLLLYILTVLLERKRRKRENMETHGGITMSDLHEIRVLAGENAVRTDESMAEHTTFRAGGKAAVYAEPETMAAFVHVIGYLREKNIPYFVMGNGSNLLVADEGWDGVIVRLSKSLSMAEVKGDRIRAQAGTTLVTLARLALESSLTGMEELSGIPGTLGGAVFMNAGAYGREMKDVVESVRVLTKDGKVETRRGSQMAFGYRTSAAETEELIVLDAVLKLAPGEREAIAEKMAALREKRQAKQPLEYPSAGSTFKRPAGHYAGALIEGAGLKGYRVGGAQVSEKHCGFVVNTGGATATDILTVIRDVRQKVEEHSGIVLEPEVRILGADV